MKKKFTITLQDVQKLSEAADFAIASINNSPSYTKSEARRVFAKARHDGREVMRQRASLLLETISERNERLAKEKASIKPIDLTVTLAK